MQLCDIAKQVSRSLSAIAELFVGFGSVNLLTGLMVKFSVNYEHP